jgi:hypothetical protein
MKIISSVLELFHAYRWTDGGNDFNTLSTRLRKCVESKYIIKNME